MTTKVERSIQVEVPLTTVYNQWTQFEDFPYFMGGVKEVRQLDDRRLHWVAEIAGVRREWEASILEQVPDQKIAWAATAGATNAGAVRFAAAGPTATVVSLTLEYEPEGVIEQVGDKLGIVERQVQSDLERFKKLVEDQGYATGAWRGGVNEGVGIGTPGVSSAASSQGDSGKAGVSGTAVAAGVAAAAGVAVAAAAAVKSSGGTAQETTPVPSATVVAEPSGSTEQLHVVDTVEVVETNQPMDEWGED
jgi:Polyketide cyclase / dehydrase and lipid transport